MKRHLKASGILAVLLCASFLLTNCGTNPAGGGAGTDGGVVFGQDPLEFTFYANYDWYVMPTWGEDASTAWIKENKLVSIVPVNSGGNAVQKMSTMITGGSLPDVIWGERGADVERLRAAGKLVALDEYIEKYPNLKEWAGESTLNLLRSSDGKIYQFPNWYTLQENGNGGYAVNKKIYKELGEPKLETLDDLYAYLKLVKGNYPDVVPLETGELAEGMFCLLSAFQEDYNYQWMYATPRDGKITSIFTDPVMREGTAFLSKLFREKLITQDAFTQKREQVEQKVINGQVAVFAASSPTEFCGVGHEQLRAQDPDAGYFMIWPIHKEGVDPNRVYPGTYNQLGWNVCVITTDCKNPEAVFAYLDWLTGPEGQRTIMWGPEGRFWNGLNEEGQPNFTEAYVTEGKELAELTYTTENMNWVGNTVYVDRSKAAFESTLPENQRNWQTRYQYEITWKTQLNVTEFINLTPAGESEEGIIRQSVADIFDKTFAKAVQNAQSDEEVYALFDSAEADAQKVNYQRLLDWMDIGWAANLKLINGN
ncbi:MAG TPA: extracellular solute-binding protein [Clostridia bacterium]|nr:extracellular solute-binding protein [Clostridia bacterium]